MEAEPAVTVTTEISSLTVTMSPVAELFLFNDHSWEKKNNKTNKTNPHPSTAVPLSPPTRLLNVCRVALNSPAQNSEL